MPCTVRADVTSALINEQLDRPLDIDLDDALPAAIRKIEKKPEPKKDAEPKKGP